jgi:hypothetical protein
MQRLKGYMPANAYSHFSNPQGLSEGTLLQRVETLEEGMELLLRAQELSWQEEEQRRRDSCCGGCVIC